MAGITEIMEALNIIELLKIFLPPGFPEVITLIMFNMSFFFLAVGVVIFTLSKERLFVDVKARITNQGKGIIVYPDGSTKEVLIKRRQANLEEELNEKNILKWIIRPEGWDRQSNGVPITIFHYDMPYNIGITEFAKFYKGYKEVVKVQGEDGSIKEQIVYYRPLILSAREVDANIVKLANAEVAAQLDPNKKLINAAIAISLILAVTIAGAMMFILVVPNLPQGSAAPAAAAVTEAAKATTTTLAHSGIAGVSGG